MFWAVLIVVIVMSMLFSVRAGFRLFRGAAVVPRRLGESQQDAEARADQMAVRILFPAMAILGLVCYALIIWKAIVSF